MIARFWGVRGSIASPGADTAEVGGNTSCVEVSTGSQRIILDAGTGLRGLGNSMLRENKPVSAALLLSHFHWDHIQGLPFFVPAYLASTKLEIVGAADGRDSLREKLSRQMAEPHFPVRLDALSAEIALREVRPNHSFDLGDVKVTAARLNHPGGVFAYRLEHGGQAIVYATDTEHYSCIDPVLRSLAEGAALLIYDAQYTPDEYAGTPSGSKVGWGHSTYVAAAQLARAAGVESLLLFHHDPQRTDAGVADIEARARELFPSTLAAREGLAIELSPQSRRRAA